MIDLKSMSRKKEIKQDLIATIKILEYSSSLRERDSDDTITYSYNNLGQLLQSNNNNTASIENYYKKNLQLIISSINDIDIGKVYKKDGTRKFSNRP